MDRRGRGESGDVAERSSAGQADTSGDVQQTTSAEPTGTVGFGDAGGYALEREAEDVAAVVESILTGEEIAHVRFLPTWPRRMAAVHTVLRETEAGFAYDFDPTRFRDLPTPTLLLVGEESPEISTPGGPAARRGVPDSRIVVLENQHHVAYRTAPERFAERVIEFATAAT